MQTESVIYLSILCFILAYTLIKPWLSKDKSQIWSPITMIALTYLYYVVKPSFDDLSRYGANHCTNQSLYYLASLIFFVCVLIAFRKTSTGEFSVLWCASHPDELQSMSIAARKTAEQFTWERYEEGIVSCVNDICNS